MRDEPDLLMLGATKVSGEIRYVPGRGQLIDIALNKTAAIHKIIGDL